MDIQTNKKKVDIDILGQQFSLKVDEDADVANLKRVEKYVADMMKNLSQEASGNTAKIAVMTAFQIGYELFEANEHLSGIENELKNVDKKIEDISSYLSISDSIEI